MEVATSSMLGNVSARFQDVSNQSFRSVFELSVERRCASPACPERPSV